MAEIDPYGHIPVGAYFEHQDAVDIHGPHDVGTVFLVDVPSGVRQYVFEAIETPVRGYPRGMLSVIQNGEVVEERVEGLEIRINHAPKTTAVGFTGCEVAFYDERYKHNYYTLFVTKVRAIMAPELALAAVREHRRQERAAWLQDDAVREALPRIQEYFWLLAIHEAYDGDPDELTIIADQLRKLHEIANA